MHLKEAAFKPKDVTESRSTITSAVYVCACVVLHFWETDDCHTWAQICLLIETFNIFFKLNIICWFVLFFPAMSQRRVLLFLADQ